MLQTILKWFINLPRKNYSSEIICDCIKMYYSIVADMTTCECKSEIKSYFIDIEIFTKRFERTVPADIFYPYLNKLDNIYEQEQKRVEAGRKPTYIRNN